ncbi:MAG: archease [Bryobacteraceae bacterium]
MYEIIEHTADIGFRASGETRERLFEQAALALVSIVTDIEEIAPAQSLPLEAQGDDLESLLVNWLEEVLYCLDGRRIAFSRFEIRELTGTRVAATGWGEQRNPEIHHARLVVKGVTYHQLRVWEERGAWNAEVYLDV